MKTRAAIALFAFGAICAVGSFGFYLNDEAELGAAAHNLAQGRLTVDDVPSVYYGPDWEPRIRYAAGHGYISETRGGAVLSIPMILALKAWAVVGEIQVVPVLLAAGGLFGGLALARSADWPSLSAKRARVEKIAIAVGGAAFTLAGLVGIHPIDDVWIAPIGQQITSAALLAIGIAALHAFAEGATGRRSAANWTVAVLLAGTTVAFWGFGQKYHAAEIAAIGLVLALRFRPDARLRAHAAAYAIAGLAFWVHPKTGGLLIASLGLVEAFGFLRGWRAWRAGLQRASILGVALLVGLAPYAIENQLLYGSPTLPGYAVAVDTVVASPPATPGEDPVYEAEFDVPPLLQYILSILQRHSILSAPERIGPSLAAAWIGPAVLTAQEEVQFGIVMLSPLVVLAPLGILLRRRELAATDAFLLAHAALVVFVYGITAAAPGGGSYDSRYLAILFPALAFYAGLFLDRVVDPSARTRRALPAAVLALLAATLPFLAALPHDYTLQFHFLRRVGLAAAVLVLGWGLLRIILLGRARAREWVAFLDVPILAMAFFATAFFFLQFAIHHPPRSIPTADGAVAHFLPLAERLSIGLDRLWGA